MDPVENMQDFNIPSIDQDVAGTMDGGNGHNEPVVSDEHKSDGTTAVQATDREALSSLLMLSKANTDNTSSSKNFPDEDAEQDAAKTLAAASMPKPTPKRSPAPVPERLVRGESSQPLSKSVKMEDLRKYFHLPIVEVARQLGTCTTALKKICRKNKISKWPYRQIRSITKSIQSLEMASLNDTLSEDLRIQYRQQIVTLQNAIDELIKDPNSVVELVNMGLSEEALQNLRESNAALFANASGKYSPVEPLHGVGEGRAGGSSSGGVAGGGMPSTSESAATTQHVMAAQTSSNSAGGSGNVPGLMKTGGYVAPPGAGNGGATGVLNLLQWPKPSADVQQIMQAAAQLTTASESTTAVPRRTAAKAQKRKASDVGDEATGGGGGGGGGGELGSGENATSSAPAVGEGGVVDVSQLEGGNLRHKKVEIGDTLAECTFVQESQRMLFSGPVHLAPLQRKKLRPNVTRKVVPLMEPDIGSNFGIEFIPQFVLAILHNAIGHPALPAGSVSAAQSAAAHHVQQHQAQQPQAHAQHQHPQQHQVNAASNIVGSATPSVGHSASPSAPSSSSSAQYAHQQHQQQHHQARQQVPHYPSAAVDGGAQSHYADLQAAEVHGHLTAQGHYAHDGYAGSGGGGGGSGGVALHHSQGSAPYAAQRS